MAGYIAPPVLPIYDRGKEPKENFEALRLALSNFFSSAVYAINDSVQRDGTRVFKALVTTLPAGTVQFEGRKMSVATNATFGGGAWRSADTGRPSWRYGMDMSLDRGTIERAAASAGALTWVERLRLPSSGDAVLRLGDAAGADAFSIHDSADAEVASIDSDGNVALNQVTSRTSGGFKGRTKTFAVDAGGGGSTTMFTLSNGNTSYDTYAGIFACTVTGAAGKEASEVIAFAGATGAATGAQLVERVLSTVTISLAVATSGNNLNLNVTVTNLDGVGGLVQADAFVVATGRSGITIADA